MREFSHENLDFWLAVENYKKCKPQKMLSKAQKIYNNFIAVQAPNEVFKNKNKIIIIKKQTLISSND